MRADLKSIASLATAAIAAEDEHRALCGSDESDRAIETRARAALDRAADCRSRLADLPAQSWRDIAEKAAALETAILQRRGEPATIEGDDGLGASLLQDLRYLTAMRPLTDWPRGMSLRVASEYTGISVTALRGAADFPKPVQLTAGRNVYLRESVDA